MHWHDRWADDRHRLVGVAEADGVRRCRCQCKCVGVVERRELMQGMNRCESCRKTPGPTCRGIRVYNAAPIRFTPRPAELAALAKEALDPRIEAKLDRLYAKRRPFQIGSAGASGAPASRPRTDKHREPSQPIKRPA